MDGCTALALELRKRLPPQTEDEEIADELIVDICAMPDAVRETDAIVSTQGAIDIVDMSDMMPFARWMAEASWRAHGLYLMVRPQREPAGSHWIGLGIKSLTCQENDFTYHVQFSHAHITVGTYTEGKKFQSRVRKATEKTAWKETVGHTHLLLARPNEWEVGHAIVWNLRLEHAVTGSLGISHLIRELEGGFKPLGYVHQARTMLYERGPTFHLSAYDTLLFQCRRRRTSDA